jgi:hypothetical protein
MIPLPALKIREATSSLPASSLLKAMERVNGVLELELSCGADCPHIGIEKLKNRREMQIGFIVPLLIHQYDPGA